MSIAAVFAAGAVLLAQQTVQNPAPATAATVAPATAATARAQAFADQDKVVCHKTEVVGTRLSKSECRTRAEWAQLTRDSQDLTNNITTQHQMASPLAGK